MKQNKTKITIRKKINLAIKSILEKKGTDVVLLDLRRRSPITNYFIICTANSQPHAQAICNEVYTKLKKNSVLPHHLEGTTNGQWVVLDYWDFIVHIFQPETRAYYQLEMLWGDAPKKRYAD
ncbi:MAG: ribosome silencing factor [candidate division WOR-3 bacterium]|nr:ribosome silencing factor [candidate division WOR-3 bacterium]MCX7757781.1 ribosome silencing factor [candidate division WOR-3 bacterium]MDW7988065.1 ribosome silencing factor [candidate division WOR-3 bacterium]